MRRRPRPSAAGGALWNIRWSRCASKSPQAVAASQGLQEVHHGVDFLLAQNPVAAERRHHGLRVAFGLIGDDRDQLVAAVLRLEAGQFGADRAGQFAALDDMAGQAIALAAVESELLALSGGLGLRGHSHGGARQQRQDEGWLGESGDQGRFPGFNLDDPIAI